MKIKYSKLLTQIDSYAFAKISKIVNDLKKKGIKVIDLGIGDPKSATPDFIVQNLSHFAKNRECYGYPSYIGDINYRISCMKYMKREYNVSLNPETEISSTIGSKEAIFNFPVGFVDSGDIVICPTPGYPVYKMGTYFRNAQPYFTPLLEKNNFLIDFTSIPDIVAEKAKIIWINYPNSPTGVSAPKQWLEDLTLWAERFNIIIASDEGCYNEIYFKQKPISLLQVKKEGVVVFYSLSKRSNMTGYRVGFIAGDKRIITGFRKIKTNIDSGTPTFIQDAASLALNDEVEVEKMRSIYKKKRDIMTSALVACGLEVPKGDSTFYLWQKSPKHISSIKFAEAFIKIGIVVTPGEILSDKANEINPGQNFVRLALVSRTEEITEAAERIKTDLKRYIV